MAEGSDNDTSMGSDAVVTTIDPGAGGNAPAGTAANAASQTDQVDEVVLDPAPGVTFPSPPVAASNDVVTLPDEASQIDAEKLPKGAVEQSDGSVRLPLKYPVAIKFKSGENGEVRTEQTNELLFRRLKGADMTKMSTAEKSDGFVMAFSLSTGVPLHKMRAIYDRMDGSDVLAGAQVIGFFLPNGLTTGR